MSYSFVTLAQAQADLQGRLYNLTSTASQQFWPPSELTLYIQEALRTWNALTSFFRGSWSFTLASQTWYDITQVSGSLRPMTQEDFNLLQVMEAHLLEPISSGYPLSWGGSAQFALTDLLGAIQRKRDQTLSDSTCTLTRSLLSASTSQAETALPDTTLTLRRVTWLPSAGGAFPLDQSDLEEKQDFDYLFGGSGTPTQWMQNVEPALSFDVDYIPPSSGFYEVLSVQAGAALSTTSPTILGIPDDWCWVVKWGALGDLLARESNSQDLPRALYCQKRFEEGLRLLKKASGLLLASFGGLLVPISPVSEGDNYNYGWEGLPAGSLLSLYTGGLNLLATSPPGSGELTLTVVENATVPSGSGDFLQVGRDDYDSVMDYAQHLAAFKLGGEEFEASFPLLQGFLAQAKLYNSEVGEMGFFSRPLYEVGRQEEEKNPVYGKESEE